MLLCLDGYLSSLSTNQSLILNFGINCACQDSEELLRNLHLAPYAKPIVSLVDDFPMVQRHKGWQFGYLASNATRRMTCAPFLFPRFVLVNRGYEVDGTPCSGVQSAAACKGICSGRHKQRRRFASWKGRFAILRLLCTSSQHVASCKAMACTS